MTISEIRVPLKKASRYFGPPELWSKIADLRARTTPRPGETAAEASARNALNPARTALEKIAEEQFLAAVRAGDLVLFGTPYNRRFGENVEQIPLHIVRHLHPGYQYVDSGRSARLQSKHADIYAALAGQEIFHDAASGQTARRRYSWDAQGLFGQNGIAYVDVFVLEAITGIDVRGNGALRRPATVKERINDAYAKNADRYDAELRSGRHGAIAAVARDIAARIGALPETVQRNLRDTRKPDLLRAPSR